LYTGAITLTQSATVKAKALKSGMTASHIASQGYTVGSTSLKDRPVFIPVKITPSDGLYDIIGRVYDAAAVSRLPNGIYINPADQRLEKSINIK
jgi:hypothetical protein